MLVYSYLLTSPFSITGFEGQYVAITDFDSHSWLEKISVPTLVIGSDDDLIFSKKISEQLRHAIPNAQYYCFENCGHAPHIEQPEQFLAVLVKFLINRPILIKLLQKE